MTREQAITRVRKLRALTVERGATPAEASSAKAAADRLIAKFDLRHGDLADTPLLPPQPTPAWIFFGNGNPFATTTAGWPSNTNTIIIQL